MDTRSEPNFTSANNKTNNSSGSSSNDFIQQQQQQQQQQHQQQEKENSQEIDRHLIVSGLYDDDSHTRKSSISFDKIKQISLTYSLQSEDDSQDASDETLNNNNDFQQHSQEVEDGLVNDANMVVSDGRRDSSSSSNQFCSLQTDGDVSDANSSRKVSVIEVKTVKGQSGNSVLIQNYDYQRQQQQPDTNNSNFQGGNKNDDNQSYSSSKMNERILNQSSFDCNDTYYEKEKVDNSLSCKAEENFIVHNTIPSYLKSNPFVFDQSEFSQDNKSNSTIINSNNTNKISGGNVGSENHHQNNNNNSRTSGGSKVVAGNNIDRLNTFGSLNGQSISEFGQLSAGRVVGQNSNGEIYALQRPQYHRNVSEDIQMGKVTRHLRQNRQQHHQLEHYQLQHHDQSPVSRRTLSESPGLRESLLVGDDATLIMSNKIGLPANTVGVDCSPRMKQLPRTNSPAAIAAVTRTVDHHHHQQQPPPGYPQRDHHVSRRTMIVQRPQQCGIGGGGVAVSGQLPPSMQQLSMLQDHSRSSSRDRIVARNTSRLSTGPESEKSSTNGSSGGLKLKQHNNSISLVLFNKTDASIIISDEPSESCSEESCWGSSLAPNSSIGFNAAVDNSLALGHQGGTNDDDAGVEGNDYLSEEDLNYNEIFPHDTSSNRDKNTTSLKRVSTGEFISSGGGGGEVGERGGGTDISTSPNDRLNTPMMTPTRVLDQRLGHSMGQNQNQNHLNQHQMFNVEKFVERPATQSKTTSHASDRGQNLVTNISVNQPNTHENLKFENQRQQQLQQQQQQQSSSSPFSSTTMDQSPLYNSYRHQLPVSNQVRNNNIVYKQRNQDSPQFYGNSSCSQSLLGIDIKQPIGSVSGCGSMNVNTGRSLGGSCNQLRRDLEDRTIRVLNNVGEHSLTRDEVMMKKNIPEAQANTRAGYIFDEGANEHFGLVHQSPIIINSVDLNSSRTNKNHLRGIDSNKQQQQNQNLNSNTNSKNIQYTKYSIKQASGNRGTSTSFYNNINNRRDLVSSKADQMDDASLYEFDGEDDDYAYSTSSVYASPVHLPRRSNTSKFSNKSYRNDGRRVDIVISSPQRYIRPPSNRRTRATGQQFWSNNSLPKSPLQEYSYFDGSQNFNTNNDMVNRRPIADARTNKTTQIDYQQSSPSPIGSQSCWSSYGSINRDNIIVGSQIENSYDENTQLKLTRLQHQQQKLSKQHHTPTDYYQTGEFSPKLMNQMNMPHPSTYVNGDNWDGESTLGATNFTDERKANNISHVFEKEDCSNSANISAKVQQRQQEQQKGHYIDESDRLQRADLSGSCAVSSEKDSSQIGQDKIGTEVSNQLVQQSKAKEQQRELSGATKITTKSSDFQANPQQQNNQSVAAAAATPKPVKLRNLLNDEQTVDNLHFKYKHNNKSHGCSENRCLASMINPKPVEYKVRSVNETFEHAKDFINNFYASIKRLDSPAHKTRLSEIEEQLKTNETYYLKETELIYGAKLAWRNAARCIGRIQWSKLQVFDARFTTNANEMFEALCNHIKYATNKGSLRSAITILPQRVKSINNDWRIWNSQLIGYAGYKNKETNLIIGDPANVEITEICQKLGWKGKGTRFDVLPLVLSANGGPPQMFTLPEDLVLRVKIKHPKFKWFEELQLEWYALPAVANMMLDVGGIQFTAAPFSGWYMVTEIGTRDLGDSNRYNVLEEVAQKMGLNTKSNMSLWKDQAVVELNIAVLDSFQQAGVTIVDHHTATDTFMTHLSNEQRLRGGCPADWVWLIPPTAGSTTQVFHQEMVSYHLLPNYEYQEPIWKNFDWNSWEKLEEKKKEQEANNRKRIDSLVESGGLTKSTTTTSLWGSSPLKNNNQISNGGELTPRKLRFKEIARAVKFTSKLFGKALSRRIKATILYATETGKSERFANKLAQTFSCAFNVHLMSMSDYDMTCLEHEALLLVVTSTFGNGDPPENGELFAKHLAAVKLTGDTSPDIDSLNSVSTNPFFQMLSEDHKDITERKYNSLQASINSSSINTTSGGNNNTMSSCNDISNGSDNSNSSSSSSTLSNQRKNSSCLLQVNKQEEQTNIRPLSNVRFGVFALGSTAYPHFCAYGRYVDQTLGELGAERILKCTCGDELCGQEKAFNEWSNQVFKTACDVFCLTDSIGPIEERPEMRWSPQDVRFVPVELIPEPNELNNNNNNNNYFSLQQQLSTLPNSFVDAQQQTLKSSELLSNKMVIVRNLMNITNKRIIPFTVKNRTNLHPYNKDDFSDLQTLCIDLESDFISSSHINGVGGTVQNIPSPLNQQTNSNNSATNKQNNPITFEAGDHVAIYPVNNKEMVEKILARMREGEEMTTTTTTNNSDTNKEPKNGQQTTIATNTTTTRFNFDQVYTILVKRENMDLTPATPIATTQNALGGPNNNGTDEDSWINHDRLPVTSIREALMRYLDITSPPNQEFLLILSRQTNDPDDRKKLQQIARNFTIYEEWKNKKVPTLLSVLEEFKTIKFEPALVTQIPLIKPRFYSVSGTSTSLTLGVVRFKTISGEYREGLCSNYLNRVQVNLSTYVYGYIRSAPAFHMPLDRSIPMILISAGTGIAPFRSFWQQRYADMYKQPPSLTGNHQRKQQQTKQVFGRIEMYFGCRNSNYILYKDELDEMYGDGVLSSINIAFSRPRDCDVLEEGEQEEDSNMATTTMKFMTNAGTGGDHQPNQRISKVSSTKQARKKMYVQDKLLEDGDDIYKLIMQDGAHVYVCGDVAMADGVYKTLANIFKSCFKANKLLLSGKNNPSSTSANANDSIGGDLARSSDDGEGILMNLRNLNRYHEDIFGAKQMS